MTTIDEPMSDQDLMERLGAARRAAGISQQHAAYACGTSPQTWNRWELQKVDRIRDHALRERALAWLEKTERALQEGHNGA